MIHLKGNLVNGTMKLKDVAGLIDGSVLTGIENLDKQVDKAFASDLMSDVLTVKTDNLLLLTGLVNIRLFVQPRYRISAVLFSCGISRFPKK